MMSNIDPELKKKLEDAIQSREWYKSLKEYTGSKRVEVEKLEDDDHVAVEDKSEEVT